MKVDLTAGKVIGSVAVPSAPVQLYLTPDGSRLLSADQLPSTWTPTCRAAVRPLSRGDADPPSAGWALSVAWLHGSGPADEVELMRWRAMEKDAGRRVLVVDDEEPLATLVAGYLERAGFEVTLAFDGQRAIDLARQVDPDVVVLDLGLPTLDGIEVCRVLRTFSDCYVVMLTARTDELDKLVGLRVGADDYVTKPFSPRELVARVDVMLRRPRRSASASSPSSADEAPPRAFGDLEIDVAAREVRVSGALIDLTRTEFDVLAALSARPRLVFSRRQLIAAVWSDDWVGDEHLVDVHIGHVRRKLGDDPARPRYIRTVRGVGYRMGDGQ